jgi:hypothetical protein
MPRLEHPEFDDPTLRRAVRRAWAAERAPAALRARIQRVVEQSAVAGNGEHYPGSASSNGHAARITASRNIAGWHRYAAAAMILLCIGVIAYQVNSFFGFIRPSAPSFTAASMLPPATVSALIAKHDFCAGLEDHHTLTVARDNFRQIGHVLGRELNCEVLSADLSEEGWHFNGASACWVGDTRAAHLVFTRDGQSLSLYTLPVSPCGGAFPGNAAEILSAKHLVAAFQKDGALHAIVATGPDGEIQMEQIAALRNRLKQSLDSPMTDSTTVPVAARR